MTSFRLSQVPATSSIAAYTAVRLLGVERAGLFSGAMPVGGLLVGALLGGSELSPWRLAGVVAVAGGIALGMAAAGRVRR